MCEDEAAPRGALSRLKAQTRACRLLARDADPVFRRQFLTLAAEIDGYAEGLAARARQRRSWT
ncbi:MAG: hypothetical protein AB7E79_16405 [Rhodospirillaceae bacterium]